MPNSTKILTPRIGTLAVLLMMISSWALAAAPVLIYNNIPSPLPPNVPSLGFQANHTSEFGDLIQFAGTNRSLTHVTLVMSDWALASDYPTYPGATGPSWSHPITLNLYNVDNSGPNPAPGTVIATRTQTFAIPWRPPADPTCADPTKYRASDGSCQSGIAFTVTFDFTGTTVPDQIIFGIAYNTQTFGYMPLESPGPYISLNAGVAQVPPTIGSQPFPDTGYLYADTPPYYFDGNPPAMVFRRDTGYTPYSAAAAFEVADADLAVTKTGPASVMAGTNISYDVTITNNGLADAQNVSLTDTLPPGTTFVSETQNSGPTANCVNPTVGQGGSINCTIPTMISGSTADFTLVFNVLPSLPAGTTISNTATVSSTTGDANSANNSSTSTATVTTSADLAVTKTGPATVTAGNNITYNVTVTNNGPSDAVNATLTDATPTNTTFVSENQNSGPAFSCTSPAVGGTGNVVCTVGVLAAGASASFTIVDAVPSTNPGGSTITNTATVSSATPEANPANNSATVSTSVAGGSVDLSITKTPSALPYGTGLPITYSIGVSNAGPAAAGGVTVTDVIPAGATFVSATPSQGSCSGTTTVTCSLGTISSGGAATIALTLTAPSTPGPVSNTATVTSSNTDTNPANNAATSTVTVALAAAIPTLSPFALLLLALAFTVVAGRLLRP